jgi:hypothetical protein
LFACFRCQLLCWYALLFPFVFSTTHFPEYMPFIRFSVFYQNNSTFSEIVRSLSMTSFLCWVEWYIDSSFYCAGHMAILALRSAL